ncbi:TauD/TfdA family dioxygenase [Olivibacter jilunii]|uniref:TauD/TfdA family dioxygenase n=1 Tax=Olivibacter jilunii TaxID=985016 RepID=UPI003F151553
MTLIDIKKLNEVGWVEIEKSFDNGELLSLASSFGTVLAHPNQQLIDILTPKDRNKAQFGTLSFKYEYGKFPLHSDTAFWVRPSKYVILANSIENKTATTIFNIRQAVARLDFHRKEILKRSVYLVKTKNTSFYSSLMSYFNGEFLFRYDPMCMRPFNAISNKAEAIINEIFSQSTPMEITWQKPKVLIFNNWICLHGRNPIDDPNRILKRIYIK